VFMSIGWGYVSDLRPPTGPFFIPQVIYEYGELQWNYTERIKSKNCHSATLSTTNPTWIDSGANPGLRGDRLATNSLKHGTAKGLLRSGFPT
jgi:hypothetical protein